VREAERAAVEGEREQDARQGDEAADVAEVRGDVAAADAVAQPEGDEARHRERAGREPRGVQNDRGGGSKPRASPTRARARAATRMSSMSGRMRTNPIAREASAAG
jgi:hypothetical protein